MCGWLVRICVGGGGAANETGVVNLGVSDGWGKGRLVDTYLFVCVCVCVSLLLDVMFK